MAEKLVREWKGLERTDLTEDRHNCRGCCSDCVELTRVISYLASAEGIHLFI